MLLTVKGSKFTHLGILENKEKMCNINAPCRDYERRGKEKRRKESGKMPLPNENTTNLQKVKVNEN